MYKNKPKFFHLLIVILVFWRLTGSITANPTNYDARQTGEVNVHIELQNVEVIALTKKGILDDSEYDFYYDYEDFTIKPITRSTTTSAMTTAKPSSTTWPIKSSTTLSPSTSSAANTEVTSLTSLSNESSTSTTSLSSSPLLISNIQNESTTLMNEFNISSVTPEPELEINTEAGLKVPLTDIEVIAKTLGSRCRSGTLPNGDGRCRKISRRRMSLLPLPMRLSVKSNERDTSKDDRVGIWMSRRS